MRFSLVSRRTFLLSGAVCPALTLCGGDEASPVVEVDKPIFAYGEPIRVWVAVHAAGPIAEEKQKAGVLHVTRPDGVRESQPVSWPVDGPGDRSWKGGVTLDNSSVVLGRYRFRFEWDQKQSAEAELTVREWDLRDRIVTRWAFEGDDFQQAAAVLTVENRTEQILRFARLGIAGSEVWLSYAQAGPEPSEESVFYPWRELLPEVESFPGAGADDAGWQNLDRLPLVTVEPNARFSQILSLANVRLQFPATTPKVEIGTVLTVFAGEAGDPESGLYPVRLRVGASRTFS